MVTCSIMSPHTPPQAARDESSQLDLAKAEADAKALYDVRYSQDGEVCDRC